MKNNNKLIAEFMGAEPDKKTFFRTGEEVYFYDTSWDWLMTVVQKCRLDGQNLVGIDNWSQIGSALDECNLDKTYQAVVEFIKQYNDDRTRTSEQVV